MTLIVGNSLRSIVNNDEMYQRFTNYWDNKIKDRLNTLEHKHHELTSNSYKDVLNDRNSIIELIEDTLQTKSFIESKAEYIENLITELEDNQIITEYQVESTSLNAKLAVKEMEIQELTKEKEDLKREIAKLEKLDYAPQINNINRTLEKIRMDTSQYQNKVELERYKIAADNCMSESDRSVSEEDSLENKTEKKRFQYNHRLASLKPDPFHLRVNDAPSSTPKKKKQTGNNILSESFHKALKSTEHNSINIPSEIDQNASYSGWDVSNNLIFDQDNILCEYTDHKNNDNEPYIFNQSKIENWELTNTSLADENLNENNSEVEKDKASLKQLIDNVENLYNKVYEVPSSEIDCHDDAWKKLEKIHKKLYDSDDQATSTQSLCEFDVMKERFQKYSEISVKLICQILNCVSEYTGFNNETDFTLMVTTYLEKLMSDPNGDCSSEQFNLSDVQEVDGDIKNDLKNQMENLNKHWNKRVQEEQLKSEEYEQLFKDKEAEMTELKQEIEIEVQEYKLSIQELERKLKEETKFNRQQTEMWEDERNKHRDEIDRLNKSFEVVSHQSRMMLEDKDREFQLSLNSSGLIRHSSLGRIRRSKESQTDRKSYIEIKENFCLNDLERIPEILPIIEKLRNGQSICLNAFYLILDNLVMFGSKLKTEEHLVRLKQLQGKTIKEIENYSPDFWKSISNDIDEIYKIINSFISEGIEVRTKNFELLENVEKYKSRTRTKLDEIQRLETENQQLLDYQNGLQSEYSYLLSMNEDQQKKLEEMTDHLIKLEQENKSIQEQIFNEKEEDIYILKEEKENLEVSFQSLQEEHHKTTSQLKTDAESHQLEIHDLQNKISRIQLNLDESQEKLMYYEKQAKDRQKMINDYKKQVDDRETVIGQLRCHQNSLEEQKDSLKLELSLSNIRLHELQKQNEKEMMKIKRCWQDAEDLLKNNSKEISDAGIQAANKICLEDAETQTNLVVVDEDVKNSDVDGLDSQRFSSLIKDLQLEILSTEKSSEYDSSGFRQNCTPESNVTTPRSFTLNDRQVIDKIYNTCETQTVEDYPQIEETKNDRLPEKKFDTCETQTVEDYPEAPIFDCVAFEEELRDEYKSSIDDLTIRNEKIEKVNKELTEKSEFLLKELKNNEEQRELYRKTLEETDAKYQNIWEKFNNTCRKLNQLSEEKQALEIQNERKVSEMENALDAEQSKQKSIQSELDLSVENSLKYKADADKHSATIRSLQTLIARKNEESTNDLVELHKKNSEKANQLKILEQKYEEKCDELEKMKRNMIETIESNESYREQIQDNLLKYQERRYKMETELCNNNKALRLSYQREVSFQSKLESMRLEYHKVIAEKKELEKKLGRTEKCLCKLNKEHDKDRLAWMNSLGGTTVYNGEGSSVENDSDELDCEVRLDEISYILRKLVFKMELFDDHLKIIHGFSKTAQLTNGNSRFSKHEECNVELDSKLCSGEMAMLRKSIDNLLSMIKIYMHSLNTNGCCSVKSNVKKSNYMQPRSNQTLNNRPKPMGSSNSFESSDNNDQLSSPDDNQGNMSHNGHVALSLPQRPTTYPLHDDTQHDIINELKTKINCLTYQNQQQKKSHENILSQKQLVVSLLSPEMQMALFTSKLTPKQKEYYKECNRKFMFRAFVRAVIAGNRFQKFVSIRHAPVHTNSLPYNSKFPLPKFSTSTPKKCEASAPSMYHTLPERVKPTQPRITFMPSNQPMEISNVRYCNGPEYEYSYEEPTRDQTFRSASVRSTHPQSSEHESFPSRRSSFNPRYGPQPTRSVSFSLNHNNSQPNRRSLSRTVAQVDKFESLLEQIYSTDRHYRR